MERRAKKQNIDVLITFHLAIHPTSPRSSLFPKIPYAPAAPPRDWSDPGWGRDCPESFWILDLQGYALSNTYLLNTCTKTYTHPFQDQKTIQEHENGHDACGPQAYRMKIEYPQGYCYNVGRQGCGDFGTWIPSWKLANSLINRSIHAVSPKGKSSF